jgi:hypothetical protein
MDSMKIRNYRRFVPKISKISLVKRLKFGYCINLLILENMEEISHCSTILLSTLSPQTH